MQPLAAHLLAETKRRSPSPIYCDWFNTSMTYSTKANGSIYKIFFIFMYVNTIYVDKLTKIWKMQTLTAHILAETKRCIPCPIYCVFNTVNVDKLIKLEGCSSLLHIYYWLSQWDAALVQFIATDSTWAWQIKKQFHL
jgi:hypothetical protein